MTLIWKHRGMAANRVLYNDESALRADHRLIREADSLEYAAFRVDGTKDVFLARHINEPAEVTCL